MFCTRDQTCLVGETQMSNIWIVFYLIPVVYQLSESCSRLFRSTFTAQLDSGWSNQIWGIKKAQQNVLQRPDVLPLSFPSQPCFTFGVLAELSKLSNSGFFSAGRMCKGTKSIFSIFNLIFNWNDDIWHLLPLRVLNVPLKKSCSCDECCPWWVYSCQSNSKSQIFSYWLFITLNPFLWFVAIWIFCPREIWTNFLNRVREYSDSAIQAITEH